MNQRIQFELLYPQLIHIAALSVKAILILVIGWIISDWLSKISASALERSPLDETFTKSLQKILSILLKGLVIAIMLSSIGVKLTIIISMLGGFSIAIGLALKGNISNISDGITLLMNRQIKVGDFVEGSGYSGTVSRIDFFNTELTSPTNQQVLVSNSSLFNDAIINFSRLPIRRIDLVLGLSYGDDIKAASDVLKDAAKSIEGVLEDPQVDVWLTEFGDSSINFSIRAWCNRTDFLRVRHNLIITLKKACDDHGYTIPFPQRDIHLISSKPE